MKLAEIMRLALRQLDEDPADISDFADLFRSYANIGYKLAVTQYYKPLDTLMLRTNDEGKAYIDGLGIVHIVSLTDDMDRNVFYSLSPDGTVLKTGKKNAELVAVVNVDYPPLEADTDEPRIPEHAHHALVDYVCYRHLMSGNAAKQSRATAYLQQFMQAMQLIRPQGSGSVTCFKNLYAATDIRNVGW